MTITTQDFTLYHAYPKRDSVKDSEFYNLTLPDGTRARFAKRGARKRLPIPYDTLGAVFIGESFAGTIGASGGAIYLFLKGGESVVFLDYDNRKIWRERMTNDYILEYFTAQSLTALKIITHCKNSGIDPVKSTDK